MRTILGALAAALLLSAPAKASLPAGALAKVSAHGHSASEYGDVSICPRCSFAFGNYADEPPYALADGGGGLLLATSFADSSLRLAVYDVAARKRVASRTASFKGWRIGAVLPTSDGQVYALLGRSNRHQRKGRAVIQVRKLDRSLKTVGTAQLRGGYDRNGIYEPFEATGSSMAYANGRLVVHTARLIFHIKGDDAPHHQVNLSFAVDTPAMTVRRIDGPYASHSFRQFVRARGDDAVFVDHGDAYPRGVELGIVPGAFGPPAAGECSDGDGDYVSCVEERRRIIFKFRGKTGDNDTGTTVNGLEAGASNALTTGVSVPHGNAVAGVTGAGQSLVRNAYLISTDLASGRSAFRWLTTFPPRSSRDSVGQPSLVGVGGNRFAVLFTTRSGRTRTLRYRLVDQTGTVLAAADFPGRQWTALGQPVVMGTRLLWVGYGPRHGDYLFGLDLSDPSRPTRLTPRGA